MTRPVPCTFANTICAERVGLGNGLFLPVFSSHSLATGDPDVTRGLIVIHGTNRNADDYFQSGILATPNAGQRLKTIVVSPYFQTSGDGPRSDEPYWTNSGWKRGLMSRDSGPRPLVSSYQALDRIVGQFLDKALFPAIREIVVTGHSAGGQVVHRYAAASGIEPANSGVTFRYVVANPSTYLYLNDARALDSDFVVPSSDSCERFNDWHIGLDDRRGYAQDISSDSLRARLIRRDVRILLGDADSLSASLDQSCGANLQGPFRFARGRTLVRFMDAFYPDNQHQEMIVPGVGHSSRSMWTSAVGLQSLFGRN